MYKYLPGGNFILNTIVSASILSADMCRLGSELDRAAECCDHIHFDVMDGVFVNNISFGIPVLKAVRKHTSMPVDVHLMITDPYRYVDAFADSGADIISFHCEAASDIRSTIEKIKAKNVLPALAVKPDTPISEILPFIDDLYMVLVMTVEPGFGGQSFMHRTLDKIKELRRYITDHHLEVRIQVDGGINEKTAPLAKKAGADTLVAGSYLFGAEDMKEAARLLSE